MINTKCTRCGTELRIDNNKCFMNTKIVSQDLQLSKAVNLCPECVRSIQKLWIEWLNMNIPCKGTWWTAITKWFKEKLWT